MKRIFSFLILLDLFFDSILCSFTECDKGRFLCSETCFLGVCSHFSHFYDIIDRMSNACLFAFCFFIHLFSSILLSIRICQTMCIQWNSICSGIHFRFEFECTRVTFSYLLFAMQAIQFFGSFNCFCVVDIQLFNLLGWATETRK